MILLPSCKQRLHQKKRGRFADVVGAALEGQAEHAEVLAAQGPERAAHFAQEALALIFVDAHDFIEQAEVVAALAGHGAKCHDIFGEAGSAVADAGIQEPRPDARVGSDAVDDLIHIGAHGFADRGHGVDEGNLHGQESVGGVLDQLRALGAGHDDGRRNRSAVGLRNGVAAVVVGAIGEGRIDFAQNVGGAFAVAADHDAIGKQEVGDGGAFAQKFGIGGYVE